ncbi:hypothetical protein OSB04_003228 [Centaurea solstitialis]|uniref:Reverse transcriptase Ty1/copia-type domain-containing protein n=1 Tax=Centaurea solstitialis TaxID=347529 RepID=A0AA38WNJ7_9ASTR|nr:hypothetical protein OSB04_003228 [Centaurea solstitialis]
MTLYEAWKGRKPDLEHLKVFGCTAHVKVPSVRTTKLDDRSRPMVYLGVEPGSKAHRLYDPYRGRICVSRDVAVEENQKWNWTEDYGNYRGSEWVEFIVSEQSEIASENTSVTVDEPGEIETGGIVPDTSPEKPISPAPHSPVAGPSSLTYVSTPDSSTYDDTPVRGFRSLADVYARAQQAELDPKDLLLAYDEPTNYHMVVGDKNWKEAMQKEIDSIERNQTWKLTELPAGYKPIALKWIFKLKRNAAGEVIKYKARLVAKGYVQQKGVDFDEVYAPVTRLETVRLLLALSAQEGWQIHHLDVKSAFLHDDLQEEVYVCQPEGFTTTGKEHMVYKLSEALYGLRQAPRAWNTRLDNTLKRLGFQKCPHEQAKTAKTGSNITKQNYQNMYNFGVINKRCTRDSVLIVGVYVDDLFVTGTSEVEIHAFKKQMEGEFEMSDLSILSYYLGLEVQQDGSGITLKQTGYEKKILQQAGMLECNPSKFPMEPKLHVTTQTIFHQI